MGNKINSFKDLEVWKYAHELVKLIYKYAETFPKAEEYRITSQLLRAVVSIPTNIAEGTGRFSKKDYIHFLIIARGSLEEVKYLVILCADLGYISPEKTSNVETDMNKIGRMLNGLINSLRKTNTEHQPQYLTPNTQSPTPKPQ
ncbi:MAG: four helix bundle protein [Bacteroidetes bacterium]|nr:four helix bundle protein [Bacteroidota bacterium]